MQYPVVETLAGIFAFGVVISGIVVLGIVRAKEFAQRAEAVAEKRDVRTETRSKIAA